MLIGVFLPEIAILAGFLSDLMNVRVRHMPTSAFGVLAAVLNWAVALLIGPKPENASFFSLPQRNAVSASASPEAAAISKLGKLFPPTLLGVASPLPMGNTATAPTPTNTVQVAKQVVAAANPVATPSMPSADGPTPVVIENDDDNMTVAEVLAQRTKIRRPHSVAGPGQTAWEKGSAFPPNPSVLNGRGRGSSQKGGARLADMVNDHFNPCAVRGLGTFDVAKRPMGIAVLTTIFFVYLLDMSVNNKRNTNEQIAYWGVAIAVLGVNIYAHMKLNCVDGLFSLSVFVPLIIGLVVGGSAFAIYQKLGPSYLPMDAETPEESGENPTGQYSACASGNGGDFVCDAYLNGRRIGTVSPSTGEIM